DLAPLVAAYTGAAPAAGHPQVACLVRDPVREAHLTVFVLEEVRRGVRLLDVPDLAGAGRGGDGVVPVTGRARGFGPGAPPSEHLGHRRVEPAGGVHDVARHAVHAGHVDAGLPERVGARCVRVEAAHLVLEGGGEVAGVGGQHHSGLAALGGCFLQEPDGSVDQHYGLARPGTTGEAV